MAKKFSYIILLLFVCSLAYGQKTLKQNVIWSDTIPIPTVSSGKIVRLNMPSQYVDNRLVDIWLPDGYPHSGPYNVVYMHDGQMLYDATHNWAKQEWKIDEVAGKLLSENKINKTIIIGVHNNGAKRHSEYLPNKVFNYLSGDDLFNNLSTKNNNRSDEYLKFLVFELKPFIDLNYNVFVDANHTFVMGSSMGGLISMYAICEYPNVFGGAACVSTHWIGKMEDNSFIPEAFLQYLKDYLPNPKNHRIYFDTGDQTLDAFYPPYQKKVDELMKSNNFNSSNWETLYFPGENHSEISWAKRIDKPLLFLLGVK